MVVLISAFDDGVWIYREHHCLAPQVMMGPAEPSRLSLALTMSEELVTSYVDDAGAARRGCKDCV